MKNNKKSRTNYYISMASLILCAILLFLGILVESVPFTIIGIILLILSSKSLRMNRDKAKSQKKNSDSQLQTTIRNTSSSSNSSSVYVSPEIELEPIDISDIINDSSSAITKTENHYVAGVSHYLDNIMDLASENYQYELSKKELQDEGLEDEKIYKYDFFPKKVELLPEPDNPYDSNAIRVVIDGLHVGYIKKGSCAHIKKLMSSDRIQSIDADIHGGNYKCLYYDDYNDSYSLEKDKTDFFITLTIYIK